MGEKCKTRPALLVKNLLKKPLVDVPVYQSMYLDNVESPNCLSLYCNSSSLLVELDWSNRKDFCGHVMRTSI